MSESFIRDFQTPSLPVPLDFLEIIISESKKIPSRIWKIVHGHWMVRRKSMGLLLKRAVNKDYLAATHADWLEGITAGIKDISKSQMQCVNIPVDVKPVQKIEGIFEYL